MTKDDELYKDIIQTFRSNRMDHFVRTRFNYDRDTRFTATDNFGPTRAQQHHKEECDINTIVRKFGVTHQLPATLNMPMQGDFTDAPDYKTSLNLLIQAQQAFQQLPSETRHRFHNDPGEFIEFFENPDNLAEARKMGLARPETPPQGPIEVRVVPDLKKDT